MDHPARRDIPPDVQDTLRTVGGELGVPGDVNPEDFIFWYLFDQQGAADKNAVARSYLQSGKDTVLLVKTLLVEARVRAILDCRPRPEAPVSLLEFASGYARVTRHFPAILPQVAVTACDIHPQAVEFTRGLGFAAEQSASKPDLFRLSRPYNVIFAFSFFTHMPRRTWGMWLDALVRHLEPEGVLIFTAHGEVSQPLMGVRALEDDGFFFHSDSEQRDLDGTEYGNTVTTFEFVFPELVRAGLKLVQFRQAGAGHHDVYIVHKDPAAVHYRVADATPSRLREVVQARDQLRVEVAALHASTSWRVTGPLRAAARLLKGR